jgi:two-component system, NtrC family, sensor histidine kinase PilS
VSLNEAGERITGYDFATLRDRPWRETPFAVCLTLAEFFADPSVPFAGRLAEFTLSRRDGQSLPLGVSYSPLRDAAGQAAGLVVTFQDLTERKQVEEQLRQADRLAALGQLAANIAHEIRNPLGAISGAVEVLRADLPAVGTNRELLDIILGEAHRLKLITGQFLDFAKPQSVLCRPCALRPLLDETLRLLGRSAECHPGMTWVVTEDPPGLWVFADADQLRQVVWNLCLNAVQAMPDGGHLGVRARPATRPVGATGEGAWVEIALADSGQGISPQELERLFDPFYTTRPAGTGLGLAIARKILESMDGQIAVESRVGVGSTFRVWLRRADPPAPTRPEPVAG